MLSRKVSGPEGLSSAASVDRSRVGERLQAALAGLQELHFLREKQSDMVRWALRTDKEKAVCSSHVSKRSSDTNTEEQRLEATLTALKQQLTRLRRQDVGLKTHLQQLDQQISELKLDVCKVSAEHLESDSRPSSGFYELSDGGLGSLSNSCTSVYSESLSSSSQLPLSSGLSGPHSCSPHGQADVSRRRSADESTAQPDAPRGLGVRLGSSGIRTSSVSSERARQRPVSTGDLDRVITPGFGYCKPVDTKISTVCCNLYNPTVDPKYRSNLVSHSGTEMYRYPSPLHAVALQSPIFSLIADQVGPMASEAQQKQTNVELAEDTLPNHEAADPIPVGYIVKLLQRSSSKMSLQSEVGGEKVYNSHSETKSQGLFGHQDQEVNCGLGVQGALQQKVVCPENPGGSEKNSPPRHICHEQSNLTNVKVKESNQYPEKDHKTTVRMGSMGRVREISEEKKQSLQFERVNKDAVKGLSVVSKPSERRPSLTSSNEENRSNDGGCAMPSEFVHAQFVPAGSQRVKVHQADKKSKAVKLRKKNNEKPSSKRHSSREQKDRGCSIKARGDKDFKESNEERGKVVGRLVEAQLRSCSESSLLGAENPCSSHLQSQYQQNLMSKSSKSRKLALLEQGNPSHCQPRKKQGSRKWPSVSEIQLPSGVSNGCQRSKDIPSQKVLQRPNMMRSVSMRPRSGHWPGVPRAFQANLPSAYLNNLNSRYPPAPSSSRYRPRCESEFSEYSAECASLFHSTIAESSEGELSDYTANRFGDSESSQESQTASDSDSSLSLDDNDLLEEEEEDEGGLVWPEAAVGPTAAGFFQQQHPHPEPVAACRIKASRALKKKIRRFQPASLKVMTLV